ncbi:MAG: hypothetical protein V7709_16405 [Halioglobus sp.]
MIEFDPKEIGALNRLVQKDSITLQQAVDNGYRPEWREELELYASINQKLAHHIRPEQSHLTGKRGRYSQDHLSGR